MVKNLQTTVTILGKDALSPVVASATSKSTSYLTRMNRRASAISAGAFGVSRTTARMGVAIAAPLIYAGKQAMEFEKNMIGVGKVADLEIGSKGLLGLGEDAKEVAVQLGRMPSEVAKSMQALKQAGTSVNDLKEIALFTGRAGVAYEITADRAGEAFGQINAAMSETKEKTKDTFDAINQLSNYKGASPDRLISFFTAGGASVASALHMEGKEIAAYGATMIRAGKSGEEAATIIERIAKATAGSKAIKAVYRKGGEGAAGLLNVLRTGANIKDKDAKDKYFENFGLYGIQVRRLADTMNGTNGLIATLDAVSDRSKFTGAVVKEAASVQKASLEQAKIAWVQAQVAVIDFGTAALPVIREVVKDGADYLKTAGAWIKANPKAAETWFKVAAGIAATSFAISGIAAVVGSVAKVVQAFTWIGSLFAAGGVFAGAGAAIAAFGGQVGTLAVAAGAAVLPFLPWAAAILAVGYAAYKAYDYFEPFHKLVVSLAVAVQALAAHSGGFFSKLFKGNFSGAFRELKAANEESIINTNDEMAAFRARKSVSSGPNKFAVGQDHWNAIQENRDEANRHGASNIRAVRAKDVNGNYIDPGNMLDPYGKVDPMYGTYPKDVNTGSTVSVHNNPIFNLNGGKISADDKKFLLNLQSESNYELIKQLQQVEKNKKRIGLK